MTDQEGKTEGTKSFEKSEEVEGWGLS